jgi:RND family efflux transporter MFP subunit
MAGQLSRADLTEGNLVTPQSVLTTLVSTQTVYAYFDGSEQVFLRLRKGEPGLRTVRMGLADESGFPHEGRIDFVDNRLNAQTGSIRMRGVFDNARGQFTPGLFARLQLAGGVPYPAVLTPERAVSTDQSRKLLFVVGEGNVAQPREVQLGALMDGMRVITQGLKAGELVVVDGLQRVRPGAPVTPIKLDTDARGMPLAAPAPGSASAPAAPASAASAA